jgi:nucleoid DNA-binding protein
LKIGKRDKDVLEKLHLLSGESKEAVRKIFEAFLISTIIDIGAGEEIIIPMVGIFKLKENGARIENNVKLAEIVIDKYKFSDTLAKNLIQMKEKKDSDISKLIRSRIRETFGEYLKDD